MAVIVTTDSTCDLGNLAAERGVRVMPLEVLLGDKTYYDGIDITPQLIFDYVAKTGNLPKTAAPSIARYEEFFTPLLEGGNQIVHVSLSSKSSGSCQMAKNAAKQLGEEKVFVVDSKVLSTGQGLLVLKAADLRDQGLSAQEIVKEIKKAREVCQTSFVVDTLEYLHKGGRCSLAALVGAKVLRFHPYIDMVDGKLGVKKKYRGSLGRCFQEYVSDLVALYPEYDDTRCFITHSHCPDELVEAVKTQVAQRFSFKETHVSVAGGVITSHCGQGTLGVLFLKK